MGLLSIVLTFVFGGAVVEAQQPTKIARIGYLAAGNSSDISGRTEAFRQRLRDLGYVEGKNIVIEYRYAEGKRDRLPAFAAELVGLKVDVIVTRASAETEAAMNATKTIPIVMATSGDPVASKFVVSLAQPGGNVTGSSQMSPELGGKRLELLKESLKKISVVAVLHDAGAEQAGQAAQMNEMEAAARALRVQLQIVNVLGPNDLQNAFSVMSRRHVSALISLTSTMFLTYRGRIVDLAAKRRLPAIYPAREFVDSV